ncbi:MAG: DUF1292 domain-containing protein [Lachnospiraceae bacterium]|nr:DUF1292 domain-containing protein [Lachnospiraceae bacterium]
MQDNNEDKTEYGKVAFETEDGETEEFYVLEQTMLGGINYIIVTDDPESEEGSFLILKENKGDLREEDFASYEILEDEKELKAVVSVFNELLEDLDLEV